MFDLEALEGSALVVLMMASHFPLMGGQPHAPACPRESLRRRLAARASPQSSWLESLASMSTKPGEDQTALAELWAHQGRPSEAYDLAPVFGWFTEGFDTADLKEAKAVLDELTEPAIAAAGR